MLLESRDMAQLHGALDLLLGDILEAGVGQPNPPADLLHLLGEAVPAYEELLLQDLTSVVLIMVVGALEDNGHKGEFLIHHMVLKILETCLASEGWDWGRPRVGEDQPTEKVLKSI